MNDNLANTTSEYKNNWAGIFVVVFIVILIAIIGGSLLLGGRGKANNETTAVVAEATSSPNSDTNSSSSTYTLVEVSQHNSKDNCWMVIDGQVYDVTKFINMHPGGDQMIEGCGIEATNLYDTRGGDGNHSNMARQMLKMYHIGVLTS